MPDASPSERSGLLGCWGFRCHLLMVRLGPKDWILTLLSGCWASSLLLSEGKFCFSAGF
uniref:Uncharacterized protein n=1 Tax=Arundo donax TaxID=35708 RepID=A0A0A9G385_ARUDO